MAAKKTPTRRPRRPNALKDEPPVIVETDDGPHYRLDADDIAAILHHTHWIAWKQGKHVEFCDRNYPGWSIRELVPLLKAAKALARSRDHFSGLRPRVHLPEVLIPVRGPGD